MNFDEFFPLLKSIFTKDDCDIVPCAENFNVYLAVRYISFYHPSLCEVLNESINKYKINAMFNDAEDGYKFLKGLIPKLPYRHIKYIKKESVKKQREQEIPDEVITKIANYLEISQREVRNILI
jgi:hypothetical protein